MNGWTYGKVSAAEMVNDYVGYVVYTTMYKTELHTLVYLATYFDILSSEE